MATASGFITHERDANLQTCIATPTLAKCVAIKKAAAALTLASDALQEYCAGDSFSKGTGSCQAPTDKTQKNQLTAKLQAALQDLDRNVSDIKALGGKQ